MSALPRGIYADCPKVLTQLAPVQVSLVTATPWQLSAKSSQHFLSYHLEQHTISLYSLSAYMLGKIAPRSSCCFKNLWQQPFAGC